MDPLSGSGPQHTSSPKEMQKLLNESEKKVEALASDIHKVQQDIKELKEKKPTNMTEDDFKKASQISGRTNMLVELLSSWYESGNPAAFNSSEQSREIRERYKEARKLGQ